MSEARTFWFNNGVHMVVHCYSNDREPKEFVPKMDKAHMKANFSIHPWRNFQTGRRQVYNTCKPKHKK
jgi:hypothetical protein